MGSHAAWTEALKRSLIPPKQYLLFEFRYEFSRIWKLILCLLKVNRAQSLLWLLDGKCATNNSSRINRTAYWLMILIRSHITGIDYKRELLTILLMSTQLTALPVLIYSSCAWNRHCFSALLLLRHFRSLSCCHNWSSRCAVIAGVQQRWGLFPLKLWCAMSQFITST